MSCDCAERLDALEKRLEALEAARKPAIDEAPHVHDPASVTSCGTERSYPPFGFTRVRQRPLEVKS